MSKERELLRRVVDNSWQIGTSLVKLHEEIEELLAQPEHVEDKLAMVEPVAWQYRTKPDWIERWNDWENCSKESYEDYKRVPLLHDWLYETRELYTSPPTHLISAAPELLEALENWINALDDPSEWMKCRDDAKKAIAKAHGIGVEQ